MAADLAEQAGDKNIELEDFKMAITMAAMLRRTF